MSKTKLQSRLEAIERVLAGHRFHPGNPLALAIERRAIAAQIAKLPECIPQSKQSKEGK
jgi:hypothetical protein